MVNATELMEKNSKAAPRRKKPRYPFGESLNSIKNDSNIGKSNKTDVKRYTDADLQTLLLSKENELKNHFNKRFEALQNQIRQKEKDLLVASSHLDDNSDHIKQLKQKDDTISRLQAELDKSRKQKSNLSDVPESELLTIISSKELQSVGTIKTFRAIKNEIEVQGRPLVQVTRRSLENNYGISPSQVTPAITSLAKYGYIEIVAETERKRKFKILKELPALP